MLAKKTSKNQVTLPKKILKGIPETDYFDVFLREGSVVLRPVTVAEHHSRLTTVREKIRDLGITSTDIDKAIQWARGRRNRQG
ncbi:MAG: AbrB/MazE/SpoVT family DNA-binding domain-containing protein [Nitrospira sp.]